jgi:hypothetical protein
MLTYIAGRKAKRSRFHVPLKEFLRLKGKLERYDKARNSMAGTSTISLPNAAFGELADGEDFAESADRHDSTIVTKAAVTELLLWEYWERELRR